MITPNAQFDRKTPAVSLAIVVSLLALHHWYAVTEGRVFLFAVYFVPMLGGLALGGILYPPLFWAIGPKGRALPGRTKALGFLCAVAGLGVGYYLARFVYAL